MPKKIILQISMIAAAALVCHSAVAQNQGKTGSGAEAKTAASGALRSAADALGMLRWSDIGAGASHLPAIDVVTTMEIFASGTVYNAGQPSTAEYHASLAYIPQAMRVEITRKGAADAHTIQTVRENYAWNESEIGSGSDSGKGNGHTGDAGGQSTASATLDSSVRRRESCHSRGRQDEDLDGERRHGPYFSAERQSGWHYGHGHAGF